MKEQRVTNSISKMSLSLIHISQIRYPNQPGYSLDVSTIDQLKNKLTIHILKHSLAVLLFGHGELFEFPEMIEILSRSL